MQSEHNNHVFCNGQFKGESKNTTNSHRFDKHRLKRSGKSCKIIPKLLLKK